LTLYFWLVISGAAAARSCWSFEFGGFVPDPFFDALLERPVTTCDYVHLAGLNLVLPGWGNENPATDLALAYEKAAAVVLAARPTYLIFAQGLLGGRDLSDVKQRPLVMRKQWPAGQVVQNQLVFEVHEYPFLWCGGPQAGGCCQGATMQPCQASECFSACILASMLARFRPCCMPAAQLVYDRRFSSSRMLAQAVLFTAPEKSCHATP
jgi:hypothetical protein